MARRFQASGSTPLTRVVIGCALALCALHLRPALAQKRGLSTAVERAQVVARMRALEANPLAENAAATRAELRQWMIDVPEIRFRICDELLGHAIPREYPFRQEVNQQVALAGAVFTIEHPERARDEHAIDRAGVEGALRVYQRLLSSRADARLAFLDDLVERRDRGQLADHVAALAEETCKVSRRDLLAMLAGTAAALLLALVIAWSFGGQATGGDLAPGVVAAAALRSSTIVARCRRIVFVCVAYFAIVIAVLHALHPDLDPRFHPMSAYLLGDYGSLMLTAFFALGLAPLALAIALREAAQSSWSARVGFGLLIVTGVFVWLAGVFKHFPLHFVASVVAFPGMTMAALRVGWSVRRTGPRRGAARVPLAIALAMLTLLVLLVAEVGLPGLEQRAFIGSFLAWLAVVAWSLAPTRDAWGPHHPAPNP